MEKKNPLDLIMWTCYFVDMEDTTVIIPLSIFACLYVSIYNKIVARSVHKYVSYSQLVYLCMGYFMSIIMYSTMYL